MTQAELDCLDILVDLERSPSRSHTLRLLALDEFEARNIKGTEPTSGPRRPRHRCDSDPRTEVTYTTFANDEFACLKVLGALTQSPAEGATVRELALKACRAKGIVVPAGEEDVTNSRGQLAAVA